MTAARVDTQSCGPSCVTKVEVCSLMPVQHQHLTSNSLWVLFQLQFVGFVGCVSGGCCGVLADTATGGGCNRPCCTWQRTGQVTRLYACNLCTTLNNCQHLQVWDSQVYCCLWHDWCVSSNGVMWPCKPVLQVQGGSQLDGPGGQGHIA